MGLVENIYYLFIYCFYIYLKFYARRGRNPSYFSSAQRVNLTGLKRSSIIITYFLCFWVRVLNGDIMRVTALFLIMLFLASCGVKLGRNDRARRDLPTATMQDFLYAFTDVSGYREWEVKAAQAKIYEGSDMIELHNLTMTFFAASNSIKSVLIANKGYVNQNTRNLEALGEVHILSSNQSELITERVFWNQTQKVFYSETNKVVTFIRPAQKIVGYNMVADSLLDTVVLDNSLGQVELKEGNNPNRAVAEDDEAEFNIKPALAAPETEEAEPPGGGGD